ncbi:hypothetical protein ACVWY5_006914 [Bradyrhizobium sp. USDA 3256]
MQCFEATFDRALAKDAPSRHRFGKPLYLDCPEVVVFEETAGRAMRPLVDQDRARRGKSLQPSGKVRRFADHRLLLGSAGSNKITDNDQPSRDTDTNPQRLLHGRKRADRVHKYKTGADRPLSVVLVRRRIAEVHEHPVTHILGYKAIETANSLSNAVMICADHVTQVLGIKA